MKFTQMKKLKQYVEANCIPEATTEYDEKRHTSIEDEYVCAIFNNGLFASVVFNKDNDISIAASDYNGFIDWNISINSEWYNSEKDDAICKDEDELIKALDYIKNYYNR